MHFNLDKLQIHNDMLGMKLTISCVEELGQYSFVNLYVYDTEGALRIQSLFMGAARESILMENEAGMGCFKGPISKGEWKVIAISEAPIPKFTYKVEAIQEEAINEGDSPKWYRGDFHTHTVLSDGSLTLEELPGVMRKRGLDFVFLTDHGMIPSDLDESQGLFKGMEVTLESGHINIHGIEGGIFKQYDKFMEYLLKQQEEGFSVEEMIEQVKGLNVSINHPFMEPWHYTNEDFSLDSLNTLEIICDPTWKTAKEANNKAVNFLNFLNTNGHRIVGIGGSDSHLPYGEAYKWASTPSWYGDPKTVVYAASRTPKAIIEGVQKGHVYVTRNMSLNIEIENGTYLPGDQIHEDTVTYNLYSNDLQESVSAHLIINGQIKCVQPMKQDEGVNFLIAFKQKYECVSVEIRNDANELIAYINPIYFGHKEPYFKTWGEATLAFDKYYLPS